MKKYDGINLNGEKCWPTEILSKEYSLQAEGTSSSRDWNELCSINRKKASVAGDH